MVAVASMIVVASTVLLVAGIVLGFRLRAQEAANSDARPRAREGSRKGAGAAV